MPGFEVFGEQERAEIAQVMETGVLMRYGFDGMRQGKWKASELERALEVRMKVKHAHLVSSGTAALTVALASAGVGAGDEIILPAFTFVASFEAVIALGAVPVLVNVDDTLTLDPQAVFNAVTDRTKVVMPVHMCGSMADMRALKEICSRSGLLMLEDACQAIGGSYEGKPLGSYGDMGCYSFDYVKTITCGEGGALITNNETYYHNATCYSDHGHDHLGSDRGAEGHPFLGYNFRISELHAAVGLAQLARLDEFLNIQRKNYLQLRQSLEQVPGLTFRRVPDTGVENFSFLSFYMPSQTVAKAAHNALVTAGIDGCFYWFDNNWHYHKNWDHLKQLKSLGKIVSHVAQGLPDYGNSDFAASDHWVGRNISCLIKLGWDEKELARRAETMVKCLKNLK